MPVRAAVPAVERGGGAVARMRALCSVEGEPEAETVPACPAFGQQHARGVLGLCSGEQLVSHG